MSSSFSKMIDPLAVASRACNREFASGREVLHFEYVNVLIDAGAIQEPPKSEGTSPCFMLCRTEDLYNKLVDMRVRIAGFYVELKEVLRNAEKYERLGSGSDLLLELKSLIEHARNKGCTIDALTRAVREIAYSDDRKDDSME